MIKDFVLQKIGGYLRAEDAGKMLQKFGQFRILCALREGPYGVITFNRLVERLLQAESLISPEKVWYAGRPIMITGNDYHLQLFNGDTGITLPDPEAGNELRVFFPGPDNGLRKFHPLRLAEYETVFAMTVHKSQGSEFDHVLLVLPDRESPILTRELIYTGITRARKTVEIWGNESIFRKAVAQRIERTSGLREALRV